MALGRLSGTGFFVVTIITPRMLSACPPVTVAVIVTVAPGVIDVLDAVNDTVAVLCFSWHDEPQSYS
jgi:hypothetical protein